MQNAVIYARYSSHGQNEQTIEGQIRICEEFAKSKGLNIIKIYTEKAKSASKDTHKRKSFQQMLFDAQFRTFQNIIVYKFDRFERNRFESMMLKNQLKEQCGVRVISALEPVSDDESGELYEMFVEWNDEKYSKRLSKRVKDGLTTSVNNGTFTGGHLIYGYKKDGNRIVVDENAAEIVKYVFNEYANGVSKKDIAAALNAKGLRYHGKPFQGRSFDKILPNAKYTGKFMFGGRLCENTYPQIIEQDVFDAVQKRAASNRHSSGANSARVPYLLQGKLFCGHCGAAMTADGGTGKLGVQYHYYACTTRKKKKTCQKFNEKKEFIEWYVCEQTIAYLSDPRRVEYIADDVVKYYESRTSQNEIKRIIAERVRVQKEIDNAVNLMVSGVDAVVVKVLNDKIVQLTTLLDDLTEQQSKLELEAGLKITRKDIISFVAEYIKGSSNDLDFKKRIIDNLVKTVYLYDDKIVIYFNIGGRDTSHVSKNDTDAAIDELFSDSNTRARAGASECSNFNTPAPPITSFIFLLSFCIFVKFVITH